MTVVLIIMIWYDCCFDNNDVMTIVLITMICYDCCFEYYCFSGQSCDIQCGTGTVEGEFG